MPSDNDRPSPSHPRLADLDIDLCRSMSHHSASSSSATGDDDTHMTYPDDGDDDRDEVSSVRYVGYADVGHAREESDEEDADDQEEDTDDQEEGGVGSSEHYPYSLEFLQHTSAFYTSQFHSTTIPTSWHDDDDDLSEDGGAPVPPVDYLAIANILTNDLDVDYDAYYPPEPYLEEEYGPPGHAYEEEEAEDDLEDEDAEPLTEMAAEAQAAAPDPWLVVGEELHAAIWGIPGPMPPPQAATATTANPPDVQQQLEQLGPGDDLDDGSGVWFAGQDVGPAAFVNPNISNLSPGNYPLIGFLQSWAGAPPTQRLHKDRSRLPWIKKIAEQAATHLTHVQYAHLAGEQCDFQGIDWQDLGVSRREARERRLLTYTNYTNEAGSDRWHADLPDIGLPRTESFFRFRRMDIRRNIRLAHFQLRNILAATSRSHAFYTGNGVVHRFNPVSGESKVAIKLPDWPHAQVSTLAADYGVLVAGGFNGEYVVQGADTVSNLANDRSDYYNYDDDSGGGMGQSGPCHHGVLTEHLSGITNHIQVHQGRTSSAPRAAFASNDTVFRVLDIETNTMLSEEIFHMPINCTALSPDRRLRVMVGDSNKVLITTAADSSSPSGSSSSGERRPEILHQLSGHRDFGFACAWADDGWTIATGFQDKTVKIWDARQLGGRGGAVETIRADMAGVRSLHFSPAGSGRRVLVAAEEADLVSIIDARTFRSKQTVDLFGEIGGVQFAADGRDLMVLCCDRVRGGLVQLERCGLGDEAAASSSLGTPGGGGYDWEESGFTAGRRVRDSEARRRRRGAGLDLLEPF